MENINVATPEMMNSIKAEASPEYQRAVPDATALNLVEVANPILNYEAVRNEFVGALVNKIVMQLIDRRMWSNPLAVLKTGNMPLGTDIEDVHINPAKGEDYDGTETGMADVLKMHKPDVASAYYRLNRQEKYPVTINNQQLRGAFVSWGKLEDFIAGIVDTLYNGATIDDFQYTKSLVSSALAAGKMNTVTVDNVVDDVTGKAFMRKLRGLSMQFTFPSSKYNSYQLIGGDTPRMSWCPIEDQVILITGDVASAVGVEVLSTLFNISYADYLARQIIVDSFADPKTLAVLCDKRAFVIMEQMRQFTSFYNASSISWQYYYHCWDLFALSPFRNIVALQEAPGTDND